MAAPSVHDASGRKCGVCEKEFTRDSMNLNISWRQGRFIKRIRVCGTCYNAHYSKGE